MNNRLINTKVAGGGGCTDIVDNYDPFDGNGVALYQLNGNATDVSGNYDAIDVRGLSYVDGVFGQAASFASNGNFNTGYSLSGSYTISFWCKNTATGYNIFSTANSQNDVGIAFRGLRGGVITFLDVWGGAGIGQYVVHSYTYPQDTNWHHFALSFTNNNNCKIYFDGALILDFNSAQATFSQSSPLTFGEGLYASNDPTGINLDQVRIFNTELTPLEVEALYTEELCICDGTVDTLDILGDGSCIATYQLDGNANDLSGNYSGTPTAVSYGVGEFDLAGVFNGTSSYITTPLTYNSIVNLNDKTQDFSFSLWMYQSSLPSAGTKNVFAINEYAPSYQYIGLVVNGSNINFVSYPGGAAGDVAAATTDLNVWTHIACVRESSTMKIYKNGSLIQSAPMVYANMSLDSTLRWVFGRRSDGGNDNYFDGSIDQVRIFNKALNSTEVTTLYNETACTKAACTGTTNTLDILGDGSCIAAYPLDGSPADLSGNYNGVQTNVTYPVGKFDLAGSFNGTSSVIRDIPNSISTSLKSNNAFTYSFWIKFNSLGYQSIIQFFNDVTSSVSFNGTNFEAYIYNSSTQQKAVINSATVTTGVWYNVVFKGDSNGIFLYVNNNTPASTSWGGDWFIYTNATYKYNAIGARQNSGGFTDYVDGQIDQVRVFNKALSAGEVTTLYNETPCN